MLSDNEVKLVKEWLKMKIKLCENNVSDKNNLWGFTTVQKYIEELEESNKALDHENNRLEKIEFEKDNLINMMSKEEINCKWLNKNFGEDYYICNGFLRTVTKEDCKNCEERIDTNAK